MTALPDGNEVQAVDNTTGTFNLLSFVVAAGKRAMGHVIVDAAGANQVGAVQAGVTNGGSGILGWLSTMVANWRDTTGAANLAQGTLDATYVVTPNGYAGCAFDIPTLAGGTVIQFEQLATAGSSTWDPLNVVPLGGGATVTSTNAAGRFEAIAAGVHQLRLRISTAGTVGNLAIKHHLTRGQKLLRIFNTAYTNLFGTMKMVDNAGSPIVWGDPLGRPAGAVCVSTSGLGTTGAVTATLAAPGAGLTLYVEGIEVQWMGATAASAPTINLTGVLGGTQAWIMPIPAGVGVAGPGLRVNFNPPIPAALANSAVALAVPAPGAGCIGVSGTIRGFYAA